MRQHPDMPRQGTFKSPQIPRPKLQESTAGTGAEELPSRTSPLLSSGLKANRNQSHSSVGMNQGENERQMYAYERR
jgi:hypothetical protein